MTGITGVLSLREPGCHHDRVAAMVRTLSHRGIHLTAWDEPGVSLRRLTQTPTDTPLVSHEGRWVALLDGIVTNAPQLRTRLHLPRAVGDGADVVAEGLAAEGIAFVDRLEGQFALVAHDRLRGVSHLVRDHMGIQPLHYAVDHGHLLFGSEAKAVLAALDRPPSPDPAGLAAYLAHGAIPAPWTLFTGVRCVEPGTRVEVGAAGVTGTVRYWSPTAPDPSSWWTPDDAVEAVSDGVRQAVRRSLGTGATVGACLSRGIDSNLVAAVLMDLSEQPVRTYTARVHGSPAPLAPSTADAGLHREVTLHAADLSEHWGRLTWHRDAPLTDPTDVAVYLVAQAARGEVDLLLTGEGGDELFGGYRRYRAARALSVVEGIPGALRSRLLGSLDPALRSWSGAARTAMRAVAAQDEAERFGEWAAPFSSAERAVLLRARPGLPSSSSRPAALTGDLVSRMQRYDLGSWLPGARLDRDDRMAMAASVTLRPPLLDDKLVATALRIPSGIRLHQGRTKWVLRQVARRYLPPDVVDRPRTGFHVPLAAWLRGPLRDEAWDRLTGRDSFVAGALDGPTVRRLLQRHSDGVHDESTRIWALMALEVWHETFQRSAIPTPV